MLAVSCSMRVPMQRLAATGLLASAGGPGAASATGVLHLPRGYAKAAAGKADAGAAPGGPKPKSHRRSYSRLFSCRNDRFRSAFEQIWPTMRLTEDEAKLFRKNSRLFVVETGRSISLKHKFDLSRPAPSVTDALDVPPWSAAPGPAPAPLKPHYAQARTALFESDLHLDAIGEHPRYLKIRKLRTQFGIRLQNVRKVRLLLGFVRRGFLQKLYEQSQVQPGSSKVWKLVCAMESRLGMVALRMGLAHDILAANTMFRRKLYLNGTPPPLKKAYFVQPGDIISPAPSELSSYKSHVAMEMGSLLKDVHRDFL